MFLEDFSLLVMLQKRYRMCADIFSSASKSFTIIDSTDAPNFDKIKDTALRKYINHSNRVIISKFLQIGSSRVLIRKR